jgi:hypothetical protein
VPAPADDALTAALAALVRWLTSEDVPYAVIGGVAVSLQAAPRYTEDIDVVIWVADDRWPALIDAAAGHAITPRRPDVLDFAARTRVLLLTHATGVPLDISCGALPFEDDLVATAVLLETGTVSVRVARPDRLLVMKAVANRPRDWADIDSLLRQFPGVDTGAARRVIQEFAEALEMPEIVDRFDRAIDEVR